ncbi:cell division protein FtsN [Leifsonia sp. AK011]|nr:hypothetical protein [Leifsonia sp. AK011]NYF10533.1 cell division protein FtsN [Leifsonia sp. AK011]
MTLDKDNNPDPGWWRRGMTQRAQVIVAVVAGVIVVGAIVFAVASGISIF